jgi:hypothetical protein
MNGRTHFGHTNVNGRIILKLILKKQRVRIWDGFV